MTKPTANCSIELLETIVHHIQLFKDTIHLYKVKAHAGILRNECAISKCSVENQSGLDIHINTDAHPHSSISWPARVENPPPSCLPNTLNAWVDHSGPPADRLSIFSGLCTHARPSHNSILSNSSWKNASVTSGKKENDMLCRTAF
jgi:hypothetical protein